MSRISVVLPILAVVVALAPASPVPKQKANPLYYPTKVGTKWVYGGDSEQTYVVSAVEVKKDGTLVTVEMVDKGGARRPHTQMFVFAAGLAATTEGLLPRSQPWRLLKLPFEPKAKWDAHSMLELPDGKKLTLSAEMTAVTEEEVTVPAGKYKAIRVENALVTNGQRQDVSKVWFAPRVGEVKAQWGGTVTKLVTRELKSFELGKDKE